jgi:fused signal recognition particle receptor
MLLGVNGAGKTTTAAKLAWRWREEGKTCLLGACDTFRAAAGEQLSAWADRLGVEVANRREFGTLDPVKTPLDCESEATDGR